MTKPTKGPWASVQSDHSLRCRHEESFGPKLPIERNVKTDQTGLEQSDLGLYCLPFRSNLIWVYTVCQWARLYHTNIGSYRTPSTAVESDFLAYQTQFSTIFTSADKSYLTYPYPTCGTDKK